MYKLILTTDQEVVRAVYKDTNVTHSFAYPLLAPVEAIAPLGAAANIHLHIRAKMVDPMGRQVPFMLTLHEEMVNRGFIMPTGFKLFFPSVLETQFSDPIGVLVRHMISIEQMQLDNLGARKFKIKSGLPVAQIIAPHFGPFEVVWEHPSHSSHSS